MPVTVPVITHATGDVFPASDWNSYLRDNINKLLNQGHRVLTVAQFSALTGLEGTKGTVAPDEAYVEVDSANGIQWHVAYESGETTNKWRYIGGPPLVSEVTSRETTATLGSYVALTTAGPSIAMPRAGDYDVEIGFEGDAASGGAAAAVRMSYDIGGTGAVDADSVVDYAVASSSAGFISAFRRRRKTGLTSVTLTSKYKSTGGAGSWAFGNRWMAVWPVRIRHDA